eukprot:6201303-Pleurochrysis_carterae.AAC.1
MHRASTRGGGDTPSPGDPQKRYCTHVRAQKGNQGEVARMRIGSRELDGMYENATFPTSSGKPEPRHTEHRRRSKGDMRRESEDTSAKCGKR